ncbi:MAG TPA: hypothetical protein VLH58_03410 [Candidatus Methylomirabilis sp.]|nr:hypothetical protein [Candidatus Methylomirabilis sp.]HSC70371.1 hypothetical protein [Candidatus Methylomirabilis sp.]
MKTAHRGMARFARMLMIAALTLVACATSLTAPLAAPPVGPQIRAADFQQAMRKLWEDHATWTRLYIVSVAGSLPDADLTAQRLLQNQTDIGNAVKTFYGEAAGNQLTALLRDHILGAAELLAAAKAGDKPGTDAASQKWYANADDIAVFLSRANGKAWPLADMKAGMKMHLDLTLREAVNRLQGRYAEDIRDYDQIHEHILGLADLLSQGIIAQFPERFV